MKLVKCSLIHSADISALFSTLFSNLLLLLCLPRVLLVTTTRLLNFSNDELDKPVCPSPCYFYWLEIKTTRLCSSKMARIPNFIKICPQIFDFKLIVYVEIRILLIVCTEKGIAAAATTTTITITGTTTTTPPQPPQHATAATTKADAAVATTTTTTTTTNVKKKKKKKKKSKV
jgi:Predicted solute binding protein